MWFGITLSLFCRACSFVKAGRAVQPAYLLCDMFHYDIRAQYYGIFLVPLTVFLALFLFYFSISGSFLSNLSTIVYYV